MLLHTVVAVAFGFQIMLNMTRPVMTLYASSLGASAFEVGLLTSAYAFFPLIVAIRIGRMTDRTGERLAAVAGTAGIAAGMAFPFAFPALWALFVSQGIVGISQILVNIALQNALGRAATPDNRDTYFGLLSSAVALGGVFGPVAGGYLAEHVSYPFVFLVALCCGAVPVALSFRLPGRTAVTRPPQAAKEAGSALRLLSIPLLRKALATSALVLYSRDIFVAYFPLYGSEQGLSASAIGWIITAQGVAMVVVRASIARISGRFGRGAVLFASVTAAGLAFLLVPVSAHGVLSAGLVAALMGAGLGFGQPLSMTTTYNASPKSRTAEVLGLRLATNRMSQMIAPLLFGLVGTTAGLAAVFYASGAFLLGGAVLTREKPGDAPADDERA
ncbi:MFS transporter [Paenibacillus flagellatus]|uniref:MFS transporter n=1 Tax=Paenibacillus flagellatus TaxID=2211139 RepID=A0A2V5JW06_9BACL|nr:MFS transporter [Paenibacillus flagellatus]PYI50838.1 MFS transporter [Paenibacillus flagellatus]